MDVGAFPILPARDLLETRAFYERLGGCEPCIAGVRTFVARGKLKPGRHEDVLGK